MFQAERDRRGVVVRAAERVGDHVGAGFVVHLDVADALVLDSQTLSALSFWRADKSPSRSTGGSGLGLVTVRKLVEAHGGTVDVISTTGRGTTFTLRLPELS